MSNNGILLDPDEWTQLAAQTLAAYPEIEVIDARDLVLQVRIRGREVTGELENFYRLYRESPDQLVALQQALVEALRDLPPERVVADPDDLLDQVFPMLKTRDVLDDIRAQHLSPLVSRPLVGDLAITYVIDEGPSVVYISEDHLARWQVSERELFDRALQNLRAKAWTPHPGQLGTGSGGLLIFNGGDGYDATRVLLPELFESFARQVPGRLVIGVPNRDFLIAFSDAAPRVFAQVSAQITLDMHTRDHPLTDRLLTIRDGQIALYEAGSAA